MDHQAVVCVEHRAANALHEAQPVGNRKRFGLHVLRDGDAFDILHHQVGDALRGAAIEEAGDIGMLEISQDLPFRAKAGHHFGPGQHAGNDFDGDLFVELVVFTERAVDSAHSAAPKQPIDAIRPQPGTHQRIVIGLGHFVRGSGDGGFDQP